jgi:type VI secretion system protein ImpL
MLSFLKRVLPIAIGLLLLALFVWYAGPYFAFADYRPFESVTVRLVLIALLLLAWIASVVLKRVQANRKSDQLVAAVVTQSSAQERTSADAVQLRERFEEAVATLKQKRKSGHSLYDLPWYVIIGAPGSGKTTALVNSGLHFPLEQRSGRGALRGIGGTRNCDWWFTDEAVLLDTAGRYTTQDSDAAADSAGWAEFLALLRKYRKRRPLNGVILAVSAQDLMQSPDALEAHIDTTRRRLTELNTELKIQLPVYVIVTKADLIAGFTEYFDDLGQDERTQVWGATFALEATRKSEAATGFAAEFDALVVRLNERLFGRVEEDRDVARRARIFAFPQQVAALREPLTRFVTGVFTSTRYDRQVLLRGVYFTSGTQEGTPIDRLLGAIGRRFGVAAEAVTPSGRGKAYFIERLLKDVMFAESGLAGVNRRFELQIAAAQAGVYAAALIVTLLAVVLWTVSYTRNRNYLTGVQQDVSRLQETPRIPATASLDEALPRLDAVRAVVDSANRHGDDTPWSMSWGLFQGDAVTAAARDAYARELDTGLLPHVAARLRQRLVEYAAEPERLYPYLKAYLMLGDPKHLNKDQLADTVKLEWQEAYGNDPERARALEGHFRSLLDAAESLRNVPLDNRIIEQARNSLRQASLPGLVYRYVRLAYADDTGRALHLDVASGLGAERVLRLKGRSLSDPVPSIYTAPVFKEVTNKGTDKLVKELTDEAWVWGTSGPAIAPSARLSQDFLDIYEKDYIAAWDTILQGIELAPLRGLPETKEALAILSGPTSPLRGLLKVIDDHTYLTPPPAPEKPATTLGGITTNLGGLLPGRKTSPAAAPPGGQVTAHFEAIHRLVAGEKGSSPIDAVLEQLRQLQQKIQPIGGEVGGTNPGDAQAIAAVGDAARSLKANTGPLPPSVGAAVSTLADRAASAVRGATGETLEARYQQDVLKQCNALAANRYPFVRTSSSDIPLADFGRLFGYGGVYDEFFRRDLVNLVDTARSQWVWRTDASGAPVGGSITMLRRVEAASRIRELFFRRGSQEPELNFILTPVSLDRASTRFTLEVEGQVLEYRHAAPRDVSMKWPGPKPNLVVANFDDGSGRSSNMVFNGPWAWLRFLDAATVSPESETRYSIRISAGGHDASLILGAPSISNPYRSTDLQQFRCQ